MEYNQDDDRVPKRLLNIQESKFKVTTNQISRHLFYPFFWLWILYKNHNIYLPEIPFLNLRRCISNLWLTLNDVTNIVIDRRKKIVPPSAKNLRKIILLEKNK